VPGVSSTEPHVGALTLDVSFYWVLPERYVLINNADIVTRYGYIMFRAVACGVLRHNMTHYLIQSPDYICQLSFVDSLLYSAGRVRDGVVG
jgi:hypothetical protein